MEYIGMDVHDRYCQAAILDDNTDNPKECRIRAERAELEEFAREHHGAQIAIEATRNYWLSRFDVIRLPSKQDADNTLERNSEPVTTV